jgi:Xaa-Pro aminopeptidase
MDHAGRVQRLVDELEQPFLVTNLTNIRYLTGFTGSSAFLLMTPAGNTFFTDGRYGEIAGALVAGLPATGLVVYREKLHEHLLEAAGTAERLDLEATNVTWSFVRALESKGNVPLAPTTGVVEKLRRRKEPAEVVSLRRAADAGDAAFAALDELLAGAATEEDLGEGLIARMRGAGGDVAGWEPIVARNGHAARPHHRAGEARLGSGVLLLDYGCVVDGYHSDMTRTVRVDHDVDDEFERVYRAVLESNEAGIDAIAAGVKAADVDEACRVVLREYGYEEQFLHSTGHGVGLDIHEAPSLRRATEDILVAGDVVTVEPGVYLPGRFGVRIEDMVLVTDDGGEVLTRSDKTLRTY